MRHTILTAFLFILSSVPFVFADGDNLESNTGTAFDTHSDKRLPPVLPGEEVQVGGKRVKVISTSGPVPVGSPTDLNPDRLSGEDIKDALGKGGVIVDNRPADAR